MAETYYNVNNPLQVAGAVTELERIQRKIDEQGEDALDVFEEEDVEFLSNFLRQHREDASQLDEEKLETFSVWSEYLSDQRNMNGDLDISTVISVLDRMAKPYDVSDKQFWRIVKRVKVIDRIMVEVNRKEQGEENKFGDDKTSEDMSIGSE